MYTLGWSSVPRVVDMLRAAGASLAAGSGGVTMPAMQPPSASAMRILFQECEALRRWLNGVFEGNEASMAEGHLLHEEGDADGNQGGDLSEEMKEEEEEMCPDTEVDVEETAIGRGSLAARDAGRAPERGLGPPKGHGERRRRQDGYEMAGPEVMVMSISCGGEGVQGQKRELPLANLLVWTAVGAGIVLRICRRQWVRMLGTAYSTCGVRWSQHPSESMASPWSPGPISRHPTRP